LLKFSTGLVAFGFSQVKERKNSLFGKKKQKKKHTIVLNVQIFNAQNYISASGLLQFS